MLERAFNADITQNQILRLAKLLATRYVDEACLTKFGKAHATLAKLRQPSPPLLFSTGKASYQAAQVQLASDRPAPDWLMTGLNGDRASQESTVLHQAIPHLVRQSRTTWRDAVHGRITTAWNKSMRQLADVVADVENGFSAWAAQNHSSDCCRMLLSEDITTAISGLREAVNQLADCVGNAQERVGLDAPGAVDLDYVLQQHGVAGSVVRAGDDTLLTMYLDTVQNIRRHYRDTARPLLREWLRTAYVAYSTTGILPPARQFDAIPAEVHGAGAIVRLAGDFTNPDSGLDVVHRLRQTLQDVDLKASEYGDRQREALQRLQLSLPPECDDADYSFASGFVADVYSDHANLPEGWNADAFLERCFELLPGDLQIDAANDTVVRAVLSLHMWCFINQRNVMLVTGCDREYLLLQCLEPQTEDEANGLLRALPVALREVEGTHCVLFLTKPAALAPQPVPPVDVLTTPTDSEDGEHLDIDTSLTRGFSMHNVMSGLLRFAGNDEAGNIATPDVFPAVDNLVTKKRMRSPDEAGPSTGGLHSPEATPGERPNKAIRLGVRLACANVLSPPTTICIMAVPSQSDLCFKFYVCTDRGKAPLQVAPPDDVLPGQPCPPMGASSSQQPTMASSSTPPTSPVATSPSASIRQYSYRAQTWALEDWTVARKQGHPPHWSNGRNPVFDDNLGVPTAVPASDFDRLRSQHAAFCEAASVYLPDWSKRPNGMSADRLKPFQYISDNHK